MDRKQIFSLLLPKSFNYTLKASTCKQCDKCLREKCENDAYVVVRKGELRCGVIDKNSIGAERSESMLHRIVKDYGTDVAQAFLNSLSKLCVEYVSTLGFTFSIDELDLSDKAKKKIEEVIGKAEKDVHELISDYREGTLQRLPGQTLVESLEIYIMNKLAQGKGRCWKGCRRLLHDGQSWNHHDQDRC